jgi:hypothetical protein
MSVCVREREPPREALEGSGGGLRHGPDIMDIMDVMDTLNMMIRYGRYGHYGNGQFHASLVRWNFVI